MTEQNKITAPISLIELSQNTVALLEIPLFKEEFEMLENAAFAKGVSASEFAREACEIYAHMYLNAYEAAHQD